MELSKLHQERNARVVSLVAQQGHTTIEEAMEQYERICGSRAPIVHPILDHKLQSLGARQSALVLHNDEAGRNALFTELTSARFPSMFVEVEAIKGPYGCAKTKLGTLLWTQENSGGWALAVSTLIAGRSPFGIFRPKNSLVFGYPSFTEPRVFEATSDAFSTMLNVWE